MHILHIFLRGNIMKKSILLSLSLITTASFLYSSDFVRPQPIRQKATPSDLTDRCKVNTPPPPSKPVDASTTKK